MSEPLLKTTLFAPTVRSDLVSRPRLLEQLEMGLQRKLTLVAAPAIYGKTTLLSEGIRPSVWLVTPCVMPATRGVYPKLRNAKKRRHVGLVEAVE